MDPNETSRRTKPTRSAFVAAHEADRPWGRSCASCGHRFGQDEWSAWSLEQRIELAELRGLMRAWPDGVSVELRRCARCGRPMVTTQRETAS
jgi:hypothetical protein